jgi:singapore isolate B (sub-type 7) whole genome shotgun sequence assembly, scaffold_9
MQQADCSITLPDGSVTEASLTEFISILIGCLAANTAHMKSASLMCISSVLYHHRDKTEIKPILIQLTSQVSEMLTDKSHELAKSCFGFLRTAVKIMNEEDLRQQMPSLLVSILPWVTNLHNRFPLRVKAIVELLVRRLGKEDVEKAMPKGKEKMLESILKNERIREKKEEIDENVSELEIGESDEEDEEEDGEEEEEEDGEEEKDEEDNEEDKEEDIKSDDGEIEMEEEELNTLTQNNEEVIETGDQKEDLTELLKEIAANENLKKAVKRRKEWEYGSPSIPQKKRK